MRSLLNTKTALMGSVVAGIGASACCVGPLLLFSLGIGGAWIAHLTALEPYRPIFMLLTVLFLGWAFWKLYLVPQSCGIDDDDCIADRTRRAQRIIFLVLLPIVLVVLVSPWILPLFYH